MEPAQRKHQKSSGSGGRLEKLDWPLAPFDEVYIHEDSWESEAAHRVRQLIPLEAKKVSERPYGDQEGELSGEDFNHSKRRLYLSRHNGHFFRKCPGNQSTAACCNYFVLNLGVQCPMNCSYCYLQSYVNSPLTQIYTNLDDALRELEETAQRLPNTPFRVGTGETVDSLALDDLTLYSAKLVEWFAKHPQLTCEFKTKTCNIKNFVNLPHAGNVVVSFSVNPEEIVRLEEHGTASLSKRLSAASEARKKGFPVAFHIDPMICVPGWENFYSNLAHEITDQFAPQDLKWISVGALRYLPAMKHTLRERFGSQSLSLLGELHLSQDGKLRYDQRLRTHMFNHVISEFHKRNTKYPVFLCMEAHESWLNTFEASPRQVENVSDFFRPIKSL